eukprot:gene18144-24584_t
MAYATSHIQPCINARSPVNQSYPVVQQARSQQAPASNTGSGQQASKTTASKPAASVGLNISNAEPTTCLNSLLREAVGDLNYDPLPRELVLANIISSLEKCYEVFESEGFAPLEAAYLQNWLHSNQRVTFVDPPPALNSEDTADDATSVFSFLSPAANTELRIEGLTATGFLLARDGEGRAYELTPDGNSLDMMKGLVRRKLPGP